MTELLDRRVENLSRAAAPTAVGAGRIFRPIADCSLSAWLFVAMIVTTVFAESHLTSMPVPPHRILFVITLIALVNERVGRFSRSQLRLIHVLMLATVLWVTCSAIAAGTIDTEYGQFALLDRIMMPFLAFGIGPLVFRGPRERDLLLKALVLVGLYLGVTAYLEVIGPRSLIWPSIVNDPNAGMHFGRARGPFLVAESDGLVMLTCAFAAWCGIFRLRHVWRVLAFVTMLVASLGCLLTLTRGVWAAFVVAFAVVVLRDARVRRWWPVAVLVVVGGLMAALTFFPGLKITAQDRLESEGPIYDRQSTNTAAVLAFEEHPLTGVGWMRFLEVGRDYVRQSDLPMGSTQIEAHNVVLARAAEIGLPGVGLWLGAVALGPGRALLPRRRRPGERFGVLDRVLGPAEPTGWTTVAVATIAGWATMTMTSPLPYALPNMFVFMLAGFVLSDRAADRSDDQEADHTAEDVAVQGVS